MQSLGTLTPHTLRPLFVLRLLVCDLSLRDGSACVDDQTVPPRPPSFTHPRTRIRMWTRSHQPSKVQRCPHQSHQRLGRRQSVTSRRHMLSWLIMVGNTMLQ